MASGSASSSLFCPVTLAAGWHPCIVFLCCICCAGRVSARLVSINTDFGMRSIGSRRDPNVTGVAVRRRGPPSRDVEKKNATKLSPLRGHQTFDYQRIHACGSAWRGVAVARGKKNSTEPTVVAVTYIVPVSPIVEVLLTPYTYTHAFFEPFSRDFEILPR